MIAKRKKPSKAHPKMSRRSKVGFQGNPIEPLKSPDIAREVEASISEFFTAENKFVIDKLSNKDHGKPLREWGAHLKQESHIQVLQQRIWGGLMVSPMEIWASTQQTYVPRAEQHSLTTFNLVNNHLTNIKQRCKNFSPDLVTNLLRLIQDRRKEESTDFRFTEEYEVDMALTVCGFAIPIFEEMAESFRKRYDPTEYVNFEMKPHFEKLFVSLFKKVDMEKIAAESLCHQLKEPVREFILESLPSQIVTEMKGSYTWLGSKKGFIGKIFLEIGKRCDQKSGKGFFLCISFINDIEQSLRWWAEKLTMEHCDSGSPSTLSLMAKRKLNEEIDFLILKAKEVTRTEMETFFLEDWLKYFHSVALEGKLKISFSQLQMYVKNEEFSSPKFFLKVFVERLEELRLDLQAPFSEMKYSHFAHKETAHKEIFEMVAGCTEKCPFCNAQCELTIPNHHESGKIKHKAEHRPQCLGSICWKKNDQMVLETCPTLVSSNIQVVKEGKTYLFKAYQNHHPHWFIPADKSFEVPMFWKWFLALHSEGLNDFFEFKATDIPEEWRSIQWSEVEDWINKVYN